MELMEASVCVYNHDAEFLILIPRLDIMGRTSSSDSR